MGILDPWREARAGILAQPFVAPDPFVNPGYNLPDHPNAPYRPTPEVVNEEVVAATQAAGTPFAPRRRFEDQGGDGWSPTSAEMPKGNPLTAPTDLRNAGMMFPGGSALGAGYGSYYGSNEADKMGLHSTGINPNISALDAFTNAMSLGFLGTNLTDQYNNYLSEASSFPDGGSLSAIPNPNNPLMQPYEMTNAAPITPVTSQSLPPLNSVQPTPPFTFNDDSSSNDGGWSGDGGYGSDSGGYGSMDSEY